MALSWKAEEVAHRAELALLLKWLGQSSLSHTIETFDFTFRSDFKGKCWVGS